MSKTANISDLGLDIKVHLCKSCVHQLTTCESIQYAYGGGEGTYEGLPNICACDGFDPRVVGRRKGDNDPKELPFKNVWD